MNTMMKTKFPQLCFVLGGLFGALSFLGLFDPHVHTSHLYWRIGISAFFSLLGVLLFITEVMIHIKIR